MYKICDLQSTKFMGYNVQNLWVTVYQIHGLQSTKFMGYTLPNYLKEF